MSWELPVPTHAFIGVKRRQAREILLALREKNPNVRVILNAVSLETVAEVWHCGKELLICEEEITQIAVQPCKKKAGSHHLMQAENSIYVISFPCRRTARGRTKPDRREER